MLNTSKVIYTDCDGVILDWIDGFFRWAYEKHGLVRKDAGDKYDLKHSFVKNMSSEDAQILVREFNLTSEYGDLSPYKDAVKYMTKLHEEYGFRYHIISAVGDNSKAKSLRLHNLSAIFKPFMIKDIDLVEHTVDKKALLHKYINMEHAVLNDRVFWLEDHTGAMKDGMDLGFEVLGLTHPYNTNMVEGETCDYIVDDWKDIYNVISGRGL